MIRAELLYRLVRQASRGGATSLQFQPGLIFGSTATERIWTENPDLLHHFAVRDVEQLIHFLRGRRGQVSLASDGGRSRLVVSSAELEVSPPEALVRMPSLASTLALRAPRAELLRATQPFARQTQEVLLEYRDCQLFLVSSGILSPIASDALAEAPPLVARAVDAKALRRIALACRGDHVELHIYGQWNGTGPLRVTDTTELRVRDTCFENRLTTMIAADSYWRVRYLIFEFDRLEILRAKESREADPNTDAASNAIHKPPTNCPIQIPAQTKEQEDKCQITVQTS